MFQNRRKFRSQKHEKERQRKTTLFAALSLVILALLLIFISWLSGLETFAVKEINIEGNSVIKDEEIEKEVKSVLRGSYFDLFSRSNSFIYPKESIAASIYSLSERVEEVNIDVDALRRMTVQVKERKPFGLACNMEDEDETCFFFDNKGYLYAEAPSFSGNVFVKHYGTNEFRIDQYIYEEDIAGSFFDFIEKVETAGIELVSVYSEEGSTTEIRVTSKTYPQLSDSTMKIILTHDLNEVFDNLSTVLKQNAFVSAEGENSNARIEYLDLRFGSRVYFRQTDEAQIEETLETETEDIEEETVEEVVQ